MLIGDIFERDVERDINPVVYFYDQDPAKVAQEVSEYIITGGYPEGDPRANPHGIHEQFVRLLRGMVDELNKPNGPDQPAAWISGFYGSGKSSFAKLLGLSLGGMKLPDGKPLAEALLGRDDSRDKTQFHLAWRALIDTVKNPMAVVFDIGSAAHDDEHIHATVVRECQKAMGYCSTSALVADYELKLEADGLYPAFLARVKELHGKPWEEIKGKRLAEAHFSAALHALRPDLYGEPTAWTDANAGRKASRSADDAVKDIAQMLATRYPGRTLFLVVDEVSQYVHDNSDRMLKLQSLVEALGQRLRGKVWLLATGQQKLEEGAAATANLGKLKDRFPAKLRVHLSSANIRDVVHQRLLKKKAVLRRDLEELYRDHQPDLALYAYKGDQISVQDFTDVYPLLPGHIDLLMEITTGLRARSTRVQGDSHAIRGLLQLLGDVFRNQDLARHELGWLITLDRIYDVLHTALDADVQMTLTRAFDHCKKNPDARIDSPKLALRVLKAVSLLELIQDERVKTDAQLIGRCLYERLGQGSQLDAIQQALDTLRAASFVDYSEKTGYKVQSSAGEEWQKARDKYPVGVEKISAEVQEALAKLLIDVDKADLHGIGLPWQAWFSDAVGVTDATVKAERTPTRIEVDFRYLPPSEAKKEDWVPKSDSAPFRDRIVWVVGDLEAPREAATEYIRSGKMIEQHANSEASLPPEKRRLLTEERNRQDSASRDLKRAVEKAFLMGRLYFRGKDYDPKDEGTTFSTALKSVGDRAVKKLYPNPVTYRVTEGELKFLIESADLAGPPPVLGEQRLGILAQDAGRYEATCSGTVPKQLHQRIKEQPGVTGSTLLATFGGPPYGYSSDIVRACVIGLMRGSKLRVRIPGVGELTSAREEGSRELLKDQTLRKAELFPNLDEDIGGRGLIAMCKLFQDQFQAEVVPERDEIANAVAAHFAAAREQLSELQLLLIRLPGKPHPASLTRLEKALESCRRDRRVEPTLKALKRNLVDLRDGLTELRRLRTDVTEEIVAQLGRAADFRNIYLDQLRAEASAGRLEPSALEPHQSALEEHLRSDRPWEGASALGEHVAALQGLYVAQRRALLAAQGQELESSLQSLKLREGFDTLSQDTQAEVLGRLRDGAPFQTKAEVAVPSLSELQAQFPARLQRALDQALDLLDELRADRGEKPTVTVTLHTSGRELDSEAALERFLAELRAQLLKELQSGHRVRLK